MTDILDSAASVDTRDERARRAVKAFRALQPTLSSYARVYSGNKKIRVELSSESARTDGTRILYRPDIELGDPTPHVRKLCDKRDELGKQRCKACAIRESVLIKIYHEIAHISEGSFDKPSDAALKESVKYAIAETNGLYADQIRKRIDEARTIEKVNYLSLAGLISPFLAPLVNSLEDARVNNNLFKARRGTKVMFDALMAEIFGRGVEQVDPITGDVIYKYWKDYPLNSQIITGVFCKAAGYDVSNWFAPVVVEALADQKLSDLVDKATECKFAGDTYELAFPVLARLRELGFCKSEFDPEPEPEPEPNKEDQGDDEKSQQDSKSDSGESGSEGSNDPSESDGKGGKGEGPQGAGESDASNENQGNDISDAGVGSQADKDLGDDMSDSSKQEDEADSSDQSNGDGEQDSSSSESDGTDDADAGQPSRDMESDSSEEDSRQPESGKVDEASQEESSSKEQGRSSQDGGEETQGTGFQPDEDNSNNENRSSSEPERTDSPREDGTDLDADKNLGESEEARPDNSDNKLGEEPRSDGAVLDKANSDFQDRQSSGDDSEPEGSHDSPDNSGSEEREPQEPIDTGADKGIGGLEIPEGSEMGNANDVTRDLKEATGHVDPPATVEHDLEERAVTTAIIQGLYFETSSINVTEVRVNYFGKPSEGDDRYHHNAWEKYDGDSESTLIAYGVSGNFDPDETVLGPALLKMRRVFADNRRATIQRNIKSGRINAKVLGKRAAVEDPRLFKHHTIPGKKDYSVVLGMDISGSTIGVNISLEKRAVMAQANLLSRMGIDFAIVAHTALGNYTGATLDMYIIKDFRDPWSKDTQEALRKIGPHSGNLDGHALEFMRKLVERTVTTDKVIMYYSDGKMPAMNFEEELEVLQREIRICKQKGIKLLGVGIRTDSPTRHGLDTVEVEEDRDILKVVKHLEKHLT